MPINVERSDYDPQVGYQYYVNFTSNGMSECSEVKNRVSVEVAASVCEDGALADLSFELPKYCRERDALSLIRDQPNARFVEGRVYIDFPGLSGDAVVRAAGRLELDMAGRIIGMEILWAPSDAGN